MIERTGKTKLRDLIFIGAGVVVAGAGIGASLLWSTVAGVIAQLLLTGGLLLLIVLQRRQMAKIQARTLEILRYTKGNRNQPSKTDKRPVVFEKNVLGILQAQQTSIDLLNQKLDALSSQRDHGQH